MHVNGVTNVLAMAGGLAGATLVLGVMACGSASAQTVEPAVPANLVVPGALQPLVISMWRESATFRRQCVRLAEHPNVVVRIELVVSMRHARARSAVTRHPGGLQAAVRISLREPERYVEHIAHELEHVLEHVDGTDLPRLAAQGVEGVMNSGDGLYETARADSVGRTVAREAVLP